MTANALAFLSALFDYSEWLDDLLPPPDWVPGSRGASVAQLDGNQDDVRPNGTNPPFSRRCYLTSDDLLIGCCFYGLFIFALLMLIGWGFFSRLMSLLFVHPPPHALTVSLARTSSSDLFASYIVRALAALEDNLNVKAAAYKSEQKRAVFLLNNLQVCCPAPLLLEPMQRVTVPAVCACVLLPPPLHVLAFAATQLQRKSSTSRPCHF